MAKQYIIYPVERRIYCNGLESDRINHICGVNAYHIVQQLLEECTSVKVKRMFLYMAKKSKHRWIGKLELSKINLGSGTWSYSKCGVKDSQFDIVIPKELADYK